MQLLMLSETATYRSKIKAQHFYFIFILRAESWALIPSPPAFWGSMVRVEMSMQTTNRDGKVLLFGMELLLQEKDPYMKMTRFLKERKAARHNYAQPNLHCAGSLIIRVSGTAGLPYEIHICGQCSTQASIFGNLI